MALEEEDGETVTKNVAITVRQKCLISSKCDGVVFFLLRERGWGGGALPLLVL